MGSPFDDFSSAEDALWASTFGEEFVDPHAQALYHAAYFEMEYSGDELQAIRNELRDYLRDSYDFDFDAEFDWEAWREAYDGTEG